MVMPSNTWRMTRKLINDNATQAINQKGFMERYEEYDKKYHAISERLDAIEQERSMRMQRINVLDAFMNAIINSNGGLTQFDTYGRHCREHIRVALHCKQAFAA